MFLQEKQKHANLLSPALPHQPNLLRWVEGRASKEVEFEPNWVICSETPLTSRPDPVQMETKNSWIAHYGEIFFFSPSVVSLALSEQFSTMQII